jgi:hypothetical protein
VHGKNPSEKNHLVFWPAKPDSPDGGHKNILVLQEDRMKENIILSK